MCLKGGSLQPFTFVILRNEHAVRILKFLLVKGSLQLMITLKG